MKKIVFLSVFCLIFSLKALAHTPGAREGSISGQIIDPALNEPLAYVNVVVKNESDEIITGGISDENGAFSISKIPYGKLIVSFQYIGYKTREQAIEINRKNKKLNLGTITLEESAESLDEVTVIAETSTIQQKVDRKVVTIGKDLVSAGTASDIMVALPSVSVDQQTGNISMRGNENVRVMVDGKLSNVPVAQLLKQIPSSSIKSIELITNPSAKYNPEGMSGIINIILHKNVNIGFNGNFNTGLAYQDESKFNNTLDVNYRNRKFNFYGSYGNNLAKYTNGGNIFRTDQNINQLIDALSSRDSHLFKVGIDFYLNDKNTLSIFTNQNLFDGDLSVFTEILDYDEPDKNSQQTIDNNNENSSRQYNFNYKLDFDEEGHNIELELDHNVYDEDSYSKNLFINTENRPDFDEENKPERTRTTINLDYINPLTENSKLEFGLQARLFNSQIDYWSDARVIEEGNPTESDTNFDYTRNIYSVYATYGQNFEKWSYQLGLRAESVNVESEALSRLANANDIQKTLFDNDYVELYPTLFLTYTASEKNSFQLNYSRRVDRPGLSQINPLPEWNTALVSSFGNQELKPQFTHSVEVNFTRKLEKGSLTMGVFYRVITDEINRAIFIDRNDPNKQILSFDNFDDTYAFGLELSGNYKVTKWWNLNGSFDLYAQTQKSISEYLKDGVSPENAGQDDIFTRSREVDNVAWNARIFNNFRANNNLSFTAFGFYRGKNKGVQFNADPMYFVNIGMRYSFLKDNKATLSVNYNDIFDTMEFAFDGEVPYAQTGQFHWESRTVFAGLSYRFGGGKYRAKGRKNRDDNIKADGGGFL